MAAALELKLLTFNRQLRIFGIMQMNMHWEHAGSIAVKLQISAIPLIADSASNRCCTCTTPVLLHLSCHTCPSV